MGAVELARLQEAVQHHRHTVYDPAKAHLDGLRAQVNLPRMPSIEDDVDATVARCVRCAVRAGASFNPHPALRNPRTRALGLAQPARLASLNPRTRPCSTRAPDLAQLARPASLKPALGTWMSVDSRGGHTRPRPSSSRDRPSRLSAAAAAAAAVYIKMINMYRAGGLGHGPYTKKGRRSSLTAVGSSQRANNSVYM